MLKTETSKYKRIYSVWFHLQKIVGNYSDRKQVSGWIGQRTEGYATKIKDTLGGVGNVLNLDCDSIFCQNSLSCAL